MNLSAVIVSWAKDDTFRKMTQNAIDSALNSGVDEVVVLEMSDVKYNNALTIKNEGEFNYNRSLNKGIGYCHGEYIALCNNDLLFYEGFGDIIKEMKEHNIHSACPSSNKGERRMGYGIKKINQTEEREMKGWCIILDRYCLDKIGKLDETYSFHYSDNAYADQLKKNNIEHYLLFGYRVDHLTSVTLSTLPKEKKIEYMKKQKRKYYANKRRSLHLQEGQAEQPSVKAVAKKPRKRPASRRNHRRRPS